MKRPFDDKKPALWITATLAAAAVVPAVILLKKARRSNAFPLDQTLCVEMIPYQAPFYSFSYTPETAPRFRFTQAHELVIQKDRQWENLGVMEEFELDETCFDKLFFTGRDWEFARIRKKNSMAWRLDAADEQRAGFYYLLHQKNGGIYLAHGYHTDGRDSPDSQSSIIRWLFKMETADSD
ncbi:MAG TPA: hypothetical protein PK646_03605 [Bacillota bacterium]|jgi:hypothetical protein|nr:hypothetical protein [Fastidiosipila sp.]HPX92573.1 hypothetical protein [Bacillota bacterium]HQB81159.1 hypothetical protein [Bacillota bacterium]